MLTPISGDHNGDRIVDAADYVVWRNNPEAPPQGYLQWRANFSFGNSQGQDSTTNAVPEPSTGIATLLLVFLLSRQLTCRQANQTKWLAVT